MAGTRRSKGEGATHPGFVAPALATLRPEPPTGSQWLHELKFDGYRCQAHINDGSVTLYSRRGLDWTGQFGRTITAAFQRLRARQAIIDGEVVANGLDGLPSFAALQDALSMRRTNRLSFWAFDLLHTNGRDLRELPLIERKAALASILPAGGA
jgi:bifunctional non-homologous end joining protein LigD